MLICAPSALLQFLILKNLLAYKLLIPLFYTNSRTYYLNSRYDNRLIHAVCHALFHSPLENRRFTPSFLIVYVIRPLTFTHDGITLEIAVR